MQEVDELKLSLCWGTDCNVLYYYLTIVAYGGEP